ncbi:hypothetical protein [Amycolatopsis sp. PS_44_ISF1]|uniref:hypothetical protein n=1 Tax=Amycolatopsis sp. PS_44_ISF1 TaxID=2974917 RepID=UPI0028DD8280|nr:hypothetical protein [Amycolatopsis sp. PS_44_ISF1]MDT8916248.1 hypothetical protein [Amycolatopsis sp. PS_44_ISF1]
MDPLTALDQATADYGRTLEAHETAASAMAEAVVAALRAGHTPGELADRTPWTDRYIRDLGRAAGVKPATRGRKPRPRAVPAAPSPDAGSAPGPAASTGPG